jgi:hypothetical protein
MPAYTGEPDDDELLTSWERGFLASIASWEGELTWRQQEKLDQIEAALEERREAWHRSEEFDPGGNQRAEKLFGHKRHSTKGQYDD